MILSECRNHFLSKVFEDFLDNVFLPYFDHKSYKTEKGKYILFTLIVTIIHQSLQESKISFKPADKVDKHSPLNM